MKPPDECEEYWYDSLSRNNVRVVASHDVETGAYSTRVEEFDSGDGVWHQRRGSFRLHENQEEASKHIQLFLTSELESAQLAVGDSC